MTNAEFTHGCDVVAHKWVRFANEPEGSPIHWVTRIAGGQCYLLDMPGAHFPPSAFVAVAPPPGSLPPVGSVGTEDTSVNPWADVAAYLRRRGRG